MPTPSTKATPTPETPEVPATPETPTKVKADGNGKTKDKDKDKVKAKPAAAAPDRGRAMAEVPAAERRLALVKLLRRLKATSPGTARPVGELAQKLGYTRYDVYCLGYHKYPLAVQGFVKSAPVEGTGTGYYLTAKGQKSDPE